MGQGSKVLPTVWSKGGGGFMLLVGSSKGVALQKLNLDRIGDRGMSRVYALWNVYKMGGGSVEMGDSRTFNTGVG